MALQAASTMLGTGRCLASLMQCCEAATLLGRSSVAFSTQAAARSAEQASTSGRGAAASGKEAKAGGRAGGKAPAGKPAGKGQPAPPESSPSTPSVDPAVAAAAASHFAPSRLAQYARTVLHRELMLKLQPRNWDSIPRLVALEASIRATETQLERDIVEKWELLLYQLALEVMTGKPAGFTLPPGAKVNSSRATGVSVRLDARSEPDAAYGFLEKLVHVLLPSQMGFEGVTPPRLVTPMGHGKRASTPPPPKQLDRRSAPLRAFATELQVANLLAFPDFEQNFSRFERLRGMRVRIEMEGVKAEDCALLLSGLAVPVLTGPAAEAALAEAEAEELRRRRG